MPEKKKKLKIMSLSVESELQDRLDLAAKKLGMSRSALVRKLVARHLDHVVNDNDDIIIVLKIPATLKENVLELRAWLQAKSDGLVSALTKNDESP